MVNRKYLVHGVRVESNVDFPEFEFRSIGSPEITLIRDSPLHGFEPPTADAMLLLRGQFPLPAGGNESFTYYGLQDHYVATWHGLCEFQVSRDGSRIICRPWANVPWSYIKPFILGRILPLAVNLRGALTLHSGAVLLSNGAVALAAKSGTGKSTMLTALACMGFPLITDDMLAVSQGGEDTQVELGTSQVRLTQESLGFLRPSLPSNRAIEPDFDKVKVCLRQDATPTGPMPLRAVYVLDRRLENGGNTEIRTLPFKEALLALANNMSNLVLMERPQLAQQFSAIARLVHQVPVRTLSYSSGIADLPEVCQTLIEDQGLPGELDTLAAPGVGV